VASAIGSRTRIAAAGTNVALLRALYDASPSTQANISTYEVTADGRTLTVQLVQANGQVAISGTLDDGRDLISGTYAEDGSQGAISISKEGSTEEIASVWSTNDDKIQIARTEGDDLNVAVDISGAQVQLAITDGAEQLAAQWDRETGAGQFVSGAADAQCWSAGDTAADMCDVACGG
jgi:hypothetical protein